MNEIKMKIMACAVVAMTMVANAANAGDWRLVTINNTGAFGVDFGSVKKEPRGVSAWIVSVNPEPDEKGVGYSLVRTLFDCQREESAMTYIAEYTDDGANLGSFSGSVEWTPLVPDSVGHASMRAACFSDAHGDSGWVSPAAFVSAYRTVQADRP